jgi:hypothetical protein
VTTVVNCRREPRRVQRYIGRASMRSELVRLGVELERVSPGPDLGLLGNPVPLDRRCSCGVVHGRTDVAGALRCYARYLLGRCLRDRVFTEAVESCRGLVLGCWCDGPCHGRVLAQMVDLGFVHDVHERAAVAEYDGGVARVDAERLAVEWAMGRLDLPSQGVLFDLA